LPKEYRFAGTEAVVRHFGNGVLLFPTNGPWSVLEASLDHFEPGFLLQRDQPAAQEREALMP